MSSTASTSATRRAICCVLIIAAVFVTMVRLLRADFINWDDNRTITENPLLAPPTLASLGQLWTTTQFDLYVPVTYTVWWGLAKASYSRSDDGQIVQNPIVFHASNLALHALASVVVFAFLARLFRDRPRAAVVAAAGALLFAVHPVQVEAVAWASGTKDVLCGLLCAIALWQYLIYAQLAGSTPRRAMPPRLRRKVSVHYIAAFVALCAAMLSKPTAAMLPIMLCALEMILVRRGIAAMMRGLIPLVLICLVGAVVARHVQEARGLTTLKPPPQRILVALDTIGFYLQKLVVPTRLCFDYGRHPRAVIDGGLWHFTAGAAVVVLAGIWIARRHLPHLAAGACLFLAALIPVLGLTPFDFQEYSTVGDHYLYPAMIGVALAFAGLLATIRYFQLAAAIAVIMLVLLAVRSADQTKHWRDSIALMRHTIDVNPGSWVAYSNLGNALASARQFDDALAMEQESLSLRPDNAAAYMNIGEINLGLGNLPRAIEAFQQAIRTLPSTEAHTNLANAYGQVNRFDDALREYERALALNPKNERALRMRQRTQEFLRRSRSPGTEPARSDQLPGQNPLRN